MIKDELKGWLLSQQGWVSAERICQRYNLDERELRGEDGLLIDYTISSDLGYKHVRNASNEEFDRWCNRLRSHAIEELRRVQRVRRIRRDGRQVEFGF